MLKTLFLLLQAGKLGKVLLTGGSMIISVFAYALIFGFWYAVGFVLLIFVHEMGHFLAAKHAGLEVGAPTFIPFVGAWIELKDQPMNVATEAFIAIAGPLAGTAGALACYYAARAEDSQLLLALAYSGFMLNLWNLIPLSPLDGGRIVAIISPKVWLLGAPLLVGLFFWRPSPMLILILVLALPALKQAWTSLRHGDAHPETAAQAHYYNVPLELRVQYSVWYFGLAAFLAIMSYNVHRTLTGEL